MDSDFDEDMYTGFDEYNAVFDCIDIENDANLQQSLNSSYGRRPPTGRIREKVPTAAPTLYQRPPTAIRALQDVRTPDEASADSLLFNPRPMTATRSAGYTSIGKTMKWKPAEDIGKRVITIPGAMARPLEEKLVPAPRQKVKDMEKAILQILDESNLAQSKGENQLALEKARAAIRKQRQYEDEVYSLNQSGDEYKLNKDLSYSVMFNLANKYELHSMWSDSLRTYQAIVKDRSFKNGPTMRMNMGNIYFNMGDYTKAIKMFQMTLDQTPEQFKTMRSKLRENIGVAAIKAGKFNEALVMFTQVLNDSPSFQAGLNLILAHVISGDVEGMKNTFQQMLNVRLHIDDEAYAPTEDLQLIAVQEAIRADALREYEVDMKTSAEAAIQIAVKVIAPKIAPHFASGFNWCSELLKATRYWDLVPNIDMARAMKHLSGKEIDDAIIALKEFEGQTNRVAAAAASNLAFVYNVEDFTEEGCRYAELALVMDQYNPYAFVNKGVALFKMKDYEKARLYFREALQCDSSCYQALYNVAMCEKMMRLYPEATKTFYKLHTILRTDPLVVYHLADCYDKMDDTVHAVDWFLQLKTMIPGDSGILLRLGQIFDNAQDKLQAFQYFFEAFQNDATNPTVLEWLGGYYVESQFYEKAIPYFEKVAKMRPSEVKWRLVIASCYRRCGDYKKALNSYRETHRVFPTSSECLCFLLKMARDQNLPEAEEYECRLRILEQQEEEAGVEKLVVEPEPVMVTEVDVSYNDPLGPQPERPKTAARSRGDQEGEELAEQMVCDLLPE